ncbi:MAG: hypothetical protein HYX50_03975 [Chloroflexi bacterium]|nr:hypothetical protein [Chloroflexota bacterium]
MTVGDILYYDLLGAVLVWSADMLHLWEPWARALTSVIERVRATARRR